ncbi:MinD/ParA family protein [Cytobacillus purgationiresistens]|uniref:Flagellar biosynthesis protein FlhG n=1 Tax=Cytobacillus purgationiresistens TaxID=863449 RepID=A0ABU0AGP0_9BACI|nr:MinD/ParA family protein [Cytobacillus purgationiresistens]MDQ0270210.1 flagellar biosynthesis protein FlhG [Cytobacillus purgationiresistens]
MFDQAENLRSKLKNTKHKSPHAKTLAIMSGKGGVGKSNISLSLALSLCNKGYKVLLFDMDIGMGNLDILMGNSSEYSIADVFDGRAELDEVIMNGPNGLQYIAGGTGLNQLFTLDQTRLSPFFFQLDHLLTNYDFILFDMGAGITIDFAKIILSVEEILIVTTPEPTSITDAYAAMKYIHLMDTQIPFHILVNRIHNDKEGLETHRRIALVMNQFLNREVNYFGGMREDRSVQQAVRRQIPFILYNHKSLAATNMKKMVDKYCEDNRNQASEGNMHIFLSKLKRLLFEG